jgi:hypothetical protein
MLGRYMLNMFDILTLAKQLNAPDLLKTFYELVRTLGSDRKEELPILAGLAKDCHRVTEFGAGQGISAIAFLTGLKQGRNGTEQYLTSYDRKVISELAIIRELAPPVKFTSEKRSILDKEIAPTDLLLIAGVKDGVILKKTLKLHGPKVEKFIAIHGYTQYAKRGQWDSLGFDEAIKDFGEAYPFKVKRRYRTGNGLIILERVGGNHANQKGKSTKVRKYLHHDLGK